MKNILVFSSTCQTHNCWAFAPHHEIQNQCQSKVTNENFSDISGVSQMARHLGWFGLWYPIQHVSEQKCSEYLDLPPKEEHLMFSKSLLCGEEAKSCTFLFFLHTTEIQTPTEGSVRLSPAQPALVEPRCVTLGQSAF